MALSNPFGLNATPLWLKPMRIIRPTTAFSLILSARRLRMRSVVVRIPADRLEAIQLQNQAVYFDKPHNPEFCPSNCEKQAEKTHPRRREAQGIFKIYFMAESYHMRAISNLELLVNKCLSHTKCYSSASSWTMRKNSWAGSSAGFTSTKVFIIMKKSSSSSSLPPLGSPKVRPECRWN